MPIDRQFRTWTKPFLPQLASWLLDQAAVDDCGNVPDLSDYLVVLPVRSAGRRLLELLVDRTGGRMRLPTLLTPADFPEKLYRLKKPLATEHTIVTAWSQAMRAQPPERLRLLLPTLPRDDANSEWRAMAELLASQNRELARDDLDFGSVAARLAELEGFHERERWQTLAEIEQSFLRSLDAVGLWDRQAARLFAVQHDECRTERKVVLAATSDLNKIVREMVVQAADHGADVVSLVHADEDAADLFDELGGLKPAAWATYPVVVDEACIKLADDAADEAAAVGVELARFGQDHPDKTVADIVISCPDDRLVDVVADRLDEAGVATHWTVGRDVWTTQPMQVLRLISRTLEERTADSLAALLRHPAAGRLIDDAEPETQSQAIEQLDRFRVDRLPRQVTSEQLTAASEHAASLDPPQPGFERAAQLVAAIESLLSELTGPDRPLDEWIGPIESSLDRLFPDREADPAGVARMLRDAGLQLRRLPKSMQSSGPATETISQLQALLRGDSTSPASQSADEVAISGWLELPLDDREAAIVTDFNDGIIPTAVTGDVFLPGSVRSQLGLNDNARRYARDAYALTTLLHSKTFLRLIVARRDSEGNPLAPSRLLFRESPIRTAERMQKLLTESEPRPELETQIRVVQRRWSVPVPPVERTPRQTAAISVTAFRDFLACSYRYYLGRELRLDDIPLTQSELTGSGFGSLLHRVLAEFGRSDVRDSSSSGEIAAFVRDELRRQTLATFGRQPLAAIQVQLEQARLRLDRFARQQAAHRDAGWTIAYAEDDESRADRLECPLDLPDGRRIRLVGRIDRIDEHPERGLAVLDYKTSETGSEPTKTHLRSKRSKAPGPRWLDLQLPLYRHLVQANVGRQPSELGYFNLPSSDAVAGVQWARFSEADLQEADELARVVAMQILDGEFDFDPRRRVKFDAFPSVCLTDVLDAEPVETV